MSELKPWEVEGLLVVCDVVDRFGEKSRKIIHMRRFGWGGDIMAIRDIRKFRSLRVVAEQYGHPYNSGWLGHRRFYPETRTDDELRADGFTVK